VNFVDIEQTEQLKERENGNFVAKKIKKGFSNEIKLRTKDNSEDILF